VVRGHPIGPAGGCDEDKTWIPACAGMTAGGFTQCWLGDARRMKISARRGQGVPFASVLSAVCQHRAGAGRVGDGPCLAVIPINSDVERHRDGDPAQDAERVVSGLARVEGSARCWR
jgi:hypothetical protein